MKAPEHLVGRLGSGVPKHIREGRDKWCADMMREGHRSKDIADALGIVHGSVVKAAKRAGFEHTHTIVLARCGVTYGPPRTIATYLTFEQQNDLIDVCARTGLRICEVVSALTSHALTGMTKKEAMEVVKNARASNGLLWR